MKVTKEKVENSQAFLSVEMEPAEVEESLKAAYNRLVNRVEVPGFRKGKAPRQLLERTVGKDRMLREALSELVPQAYEKAIKQENIEALTDPKLEIVTTEPVVFKATVPLKPTVKLGDYKQIRVERKLEEVTEANINSVIEALRHDVATWEPVERPVQFNDMVIFDIESTVEDKPFIVQNGAQYRVTEGIANPVPGFAEQMVGIKKGEPKEFKLTLPADFHQKEIAGKEASFKVTLNEIKEEKLPDLNDDFAKQINAEYQTLETLRNKVTEDLKQRAEQKGRVDQEDEIIKQLVEKSQIEFPPVMVEAEVDRLMDQQERRLQQIGGISLEQYLKNAGKTEEQLHEELHPAAEKRVKESLALGKVSEEEKIEVSEDEINAEIQKITAGTTSNKEELEKALNTEDSRASIKRMLLTRKTLDRLVEITGGGTKAS